MRFCLCLYITIHSTVLQAPIFRHGDIRHILYVIYPLAGFIRGRMSKMQVQKGKTKKSGKVFFSSSGQLYILMPKGRGFTALW